MKILVIEDDMFLQTLIARKFVNAGIEVVAVTNGREALELFLKEKPDVVLLDIMLPDVDGFEILKSVGENSYLKTIPIIVFSNLSDEEHIERALSLGAKAYIVKAQFTLDQLITRISEVLSPTKTTSLETKNVTDFFKELTE